MRRLKYVAVLARSAVLASMVVGASSASARRDAAVTWGKAGVTLSRYREDAMFCNRLGAYRDITKAEPTKRFLRAWRLQEENMNMPRASGASFEEQVRITRTYRPERQMDQIGAFQLSATERCLTERGYTRFRLTKEQARLLRRYAKGTPSRHAYLHSIASDQTVLTDQAAN